MTNPYGVPEISLVELAERQNNQEAFLWLDVREPNENGAVQIDYERIELVPLSQLSARQLDALPEPANYKNADIVVMCD